MNIENLENIKKTISHLVRLLPKDEREFFLSTIPIDEDSEDWKTDVDSAIGWLEESIGRFPR